eukprot:CAMPEP_0117010170 /NCGR_PEP_ID=MMETSP0472-20121206/9036_1 /TAXON_ID=693140 ORGANISM="Tiarina fusus, Strain LIS" /NCGR_SAMPLE_ID=MMETSP0472 /ASSEMBLY_ACC=CAM_ASM_000603 /LENGTH=350 /DNA_ID=CAMNT_0004712643 /DNA_START=1 /DNA_END=1054 /DNA_ORIENTATION=-
MRTNKPTDTRIKEIADKMKQKGTKTIFYVGAGCSASAGVPTFHGKGAAGSILHVREDETDLVMPSFAHRAIRAIIENNYASHATTSNHDGLMHKTGLNSDFITEMFGSSYVEICLNVPKKIRRSTATPPLNRKCEKCGGRLNKKGCRYGQAIESDKLDRGNKEANGSDIAICLGSGMHTWPFTLDGMCGKAPLRVVVNLGRSSADGFPGVDKYDMECDEFMKELVKALEVEIEPFIYEQKFAAFWKWDDLDTKTYISVGLRSGGANEAVTFAKDEVEIVHRGAVKIMERNGMRWTYEESGIEVNDGELISLRIFPKEEFDVPEPIIVELVIDASKSENSVTKVFNTAPIL